MVMTKGIKDRETLTEWTQYTANCRFSAACHLVVVVPLCGIQLSLSINAKSTCLKPADTEEAGTWEDADSDMSCLKKFTSTTHEFQQDHSYTAMKISSIFFIR